MYAGIVGGQKRAPLELDPLELELQAVVNHLMQMLGAALESTARAISRAPIFLFETRSLTWPRSVKLDKLLGQQALDVHLSPMSLL